MGTAPEHDYGLGDAPERLVVRILEGARPAYWLALAATVLVVGFARLAGAL